MRKMKSSSSLWSAVSEDLVHEILVRLPVKSLMRFKCVNRSWNALFTTTPSFITRYLHIHENEKKERHMCFIHTVSYDKYQKNLYKCWLKLLLSDGTSSVTEDVKNPFLQIEPSFREIEVNPLPSYKGVFCLYKDNGSSSSFQTILWNPSTREVKAIPPPPSLPNYRLYYEGVRYCRFLFCGFGGHPDTNDLMIVNLVVIDGRVRHLIDGRLRHLYGEIYSSAELYNLSTNSWTTLAIKKDINLVPIKMFVTDRGIVSESIVANGVCHWLFNTQTRQECIICFHFRNNQFTKLELPLHHLEHDHHGSLADINDSIAYVVRCELPLGGLEIWILEQDTFCWNKKYKFGPIDWSVIHWPIRPIHVFNLWNDDGVEFIGLSRLDGQGHLVSYNSHGQPMRHFKVTTEIYKYLRCFVYIRKYVENMAPLSFYSSS